MSKNRINLKFIITILLVAVFFSCNTSSVFAADKDSSLADIQKRGKLVVGLSADYPPYEFHKTIKGKDTVVGFDISIAQKIADDMGVDLYISQMDFDSLLPALKTNKIDVIVSGMSPTPERLKEVDFSDPYMTVQQKVVIRKEDKDKFRAVTDFDGANVGAQKQSTQEALAQDELRGANVKSLSKVTTLMLELQQKKLDAVVLEGPVAEAYISQYNDLMISDVAFVNGTKQTAIAMNKGTTSLQKSINTSLKEIREKGLLKQYQDEASKAMFQEGNFFTQYGSYYVKGTLYTIGIAAIGVFFGAVIGALIALMKLARTRWLRWPANCYIEFVRGTPLLVQIFLVYFGTTVVFSGFNLPAIIAGCIALSLNSAAYVAEIIRAGIMAVDKGQEEAARSLGMTKSASMRYIILPQAIKNILPALGNEFITVIKESSMVSIIGIGELMFMSGVVAGASLNAFLPYAVAAVIYFILTFGLSRLLGVAERRMRTSD
ncbi:ABC transporter permease subunit [Listeria booriae]|uniref:ABC transporter permease subunit n=1 Tax=Listeria booriae TaxID=1552123 RepID=A0A7X1A9V9_9LIST|nr:ABC transporter permease subunit [Listeria booriae]MBC1650639.1 ABC transporter permease subunit [Listeria booriae]MBC2373131.1 ABC transporter permease subunit [Listeria booriae]